MRPVMRVGMLLVALVGSAFAPGLGQAAVTARDGATAAGLTGSTETWSARPVDIDRDGRQDICVVEHDRGITLWRNRGDGTYARWQHWPRIDAAGLIPDRHDCVTADFDHNGLPDLYITAGRSQANHVKTGQDNELWLQGPKGRFTDVGTEWGGGDPCGRSHHAAALDFDRDGWTDLFVGDASPRDDPDDPCDDPANGLPNEASKLYRNDHGKGFTDVSAAYGIGGYMGPHCASAVDYDGDGWTDLLSCSARGVWLWHNIGGRRFVDVAPALGLLATDLDDAVLGRVDRDARPDLVTVVAGRVEVRLNRGGSFGPPEAVAAVPDGRAVAVADADADGDGDLFVVRSDVPDRTNPDDDVLLNNRLQFHSVAVPPAPGIGDAVTALDGNNDHRAEFLVLNGAEDAVAPLQLIRVSG